MIYLKAKSMDLDSSNFDPKRYVLTMLKQNTIKELIRKNNEIDEEIKVHDHEIQSLVFQNYSKFISSIDTVRQMKDNICMVDDKLKVLESSMDKISDLALKIDETFKFKRKEIQKLDTVNRDLQKLRNLCDFPNVLKQDLAEYKSIHESKIGESFADGPKLFHKSIAVYEECFKTLEDLKSQPLIEPIYKESKYKIEEVRSILRTRQVQFSKEKPSSKSLRAITRSLIIISDEQNQVSALRSYFHSWKQRLMLKKIAAASTNKTGQPQISNKFDRTVSFVELLNDSKVLEISQEFWADFIIQFQFLYDELYNKLVLSDEILLLVANYCRGVFNWALTNELEEIPQNCCSFKTYVHANHIVTSNLRAALKKVECKDVLESSESESRQKLHSELQAKLEQKIENVSKTMINFVFGRLKLAIMEQIGESKRSASTVTVSEELLKETYIKIMGPIKQNFKNNYEPVLNDLQHLNSSYENIYSSRDKYQACIHEQIDSFIRFLGTVVSLLPGQITQEIYQQINNSPKLHKQQKSYIQTIVRQFVEIEDNGCWYAVAHNFLNYLVNQLGKRIIESAHKRIEISQNHNYAGVFTATKVRLGDNLMNLVRHYTNSIMMLPREERIFTNLREFIEIVNSIFPDSRRGILKKPSFLSEGKSFIHETEILSAKKLRILERQIVIQRSHILTIFIRRLLKLALIKLRIATVHGEERVLDINNIYCMVQACYEMGNVEQQSQISAYYQLLLKNCADKSSQTYSQQQLEKKYVEVRRKYLDVTPQ